LKRLDESLPRQLGEILIKHGRATLTDPKLCENLLKDYCAPYKEEISLLVLAVKERVASDLLVSQDGLDRDLLRALLVKRLRKNHSVTEADARWAVDSWTLAIRTLSRSESAPPANSDPRSIRTPDPSTPWPNSGVIGRCSKAIRSVAVSPLNETIVSGGDDGAIRLWQPGSVTTVKECAAPVSALAVSPNGVLIASASGTSIEIVDLHSKDVTLFGEAGKQPSLVFSPGGKSLASASADAHCEIQVWNLQTGQMRVLKDLSKGPSSISFSPDGLQLASTDRDLTNPAIRLWDLETGKPRMLGRSTRQITSVAWLPDGKHLASGSWDETVRLWNVHTGEARILGENCSCICRIAISLKGDRLAAYGLDGKLRVWDMDTIRSRTVGECFGVNSISFMTNGQTLVTGSDDGTLRLWDAGQQNRLSENR
jgi:WD40 repeat protein